MLSPATVETLPDIPATVVTFGATPATVVMFADIGPNAARSLCIGARVVSVFVAIVPSCMSANSAMSVDAAETVWTSVILGPASTAPVDALKASVFPLRVSTSGRTSDTFASKSVSCNALFA